MTALPLTKVNPFTHDVVFIDGFWGSGKSVLAPLMSGMRGLEKQRIDPAFEYMCVLQYLDKIAPDAAVAMLQTYADMTQYHNLIGREVNLRWSDDSGILNNPGSLKYLARILSKDEGDGVVERINRENLGLNIMSHILLPVAGPLFTAFGERLKIVEMVRHPVYMVKHWQAYLSRFDGAREFTLSFDVQGQKVPWFAKDWIDEYLGLSVMDRILASLARLYARLIAVVDAAPPNRVLVVSFEDAAFKTSQMLDRLSAFLGRAHYPRVGAALKKQKLPRERLNLGKGHAAYGWTPADAKASERDDYGALLDAVRAAGTPKYIDEFMTLVGIYNRRWPSVLSEFE